MKDCELCDAPARMYCESDQASLCWDCDAKVHCANFLVARHTRSLLCHSCQSPTPWKASGSKLGPTISICERCVSRCNGREERDHRNDDESEGPDDDDEEEDEEDEDEDDDEIDGEDDHTDDNDDEDDDEHDDVGDDEEDGENQVVPWSSTPPPPIASSSSSEDSSSSRFCNGGGGGGGGSVGESTSTALLSLKRMREKLDLSSQEDLGGCSPSQSNYNPNLAAAIVGRADEEATSLISFRPLKDRKLTLAIQSESKSSAPIVSSLKRFEQRVLSGDNTSEAILAICKLSKDPRAV